MIIDWWRVKIFVLPGATDSRKQINGLSVIVQEELSCDVFSGNLFLFCNRRRTHLKALYWDRTGFCLWLKQLEKDRFPWPHAEKAAREITAEQLRMLLEGIDFWRAYTRLEYSQLKIASVLY